MNNKVLQDFADSLAEDINIPLNVSIDTLPFDKSYKGYVKTILGNNNYVITINKMDYTIKHKTRMLNQGEEVWVTVAQNNWNNLFIH